MKRMFTVLLLGVFLSFSGTSIALADAYTVTITVDGNPITLTVSTDTVGLTVTSEITSVEVIAVEQIDPIPTSQPSAEQFTINRNANLRTGPGTSFAIAGSARAGDTVTVVRTNTAGDWYELSTGDWIAAFLVDAVTPSSTVVSTATAASTATQVQATRAAATATATPLPPRPTDTPVPPTPVPPRSVPPTSVPPTPEPETVAPSMANIALVIVENQGRKEILGIRNTNTSAMAIGGWRLSGSKGDDFCVIPNGIVLEAGQTYHIATGDSQPPTPGYKCGDKTIWNNSGETIYLRATDGQQIQTGT